MFLANKLNKGGNLSSPDGQFNYVTMLLHGDGTNGAQNNTFVDSSTNNFTITRNGNTTQGSFSPYGDNWSNFFDGTGDYLTSSCGSVGTGDFTIEGFFYFNATPSTMGLFQASSTSGGFAPNQSANLAVATNTSSTWQIYAKNTFTTSSSTSVPVGAWAHMALVRNGTTTVLYINGAVVITLTSDSTNYSTSFIGLGGIYDNSSYLLNGYLSNFRVVVGTAVYTAAFTPPTTALTAITNTSLLTCQSNRFVDNSSSPKTITRNGDTSVQRFNPFGASTAYSTSVIGGSGYFDGSGDYLDTPTNSAFAFGTGDFTSELWVYLSRSNGTIIYEPRSSGQENNPCIAYGVITSGKFEVITNSVQISSSSSFAIAQWHHVAIVRSGTTLTLWVNGTSQGTSTLSTNLTNNDRIRIGDYFSAGSYPFQGYVSNLRVVKGTAVYTSAFTPSTSPLSAITNTSLLLNMTNGAIFDNAMMNDLETVGNAQISTSVKKYGTASLYFDGTGDYLTGPSTPSIAFGSGAYTVEFWLFKDSSGTGERGILQTHTASLYGLSIFLDGTTIYFDERTNTYSGTNPRISGTISQDTWIHVAVCRQTGTSGTLRAFVNGTQIGSSVTSNLRDMTSTGPINIGTSSVATNPLKGYIDDLRITNGFARYTANFTAPTAAFSDTGPY